MPAGEVSLAGDVGPDGRVQVPVQQHLRPGPGGPRRLRVEPSRAGTPAATLCRPWGGPARAPVAHRDARLQRHLVKHRGNPTALLPGHRQRPAEISETSRTRAPGKTKGLATCIANPLILMAPRPGLEPGTYGLTGGAANRAAARMDARFRGRSPPVSAGLANVVSPGIDSPELLDIGRRRDLDGGEDSRAERAVAALVRRVVRTGARAPQVVVVGVLEHGVAFDDAGASRQLAHPAISRSFGAAVSVQRALM